MANDQGKMGNIIGLSLMADLLDKEIPEVGTTVFNHLILLFRRSFNWKECWKTF